MKKTIVKNDEYFMEKALAQARKAFAMNEVPVGAVIVDKNGLIIGSGYNRVESLKSPLAHAELRAITRATKKKKDWRLEDCTIYITLEPCGMCANAIGLSRCSRIVYGTESPLFGYRLDKKGGFYIYKKHTKEIVKNIKKEECEGLLKQFFKKQRREKNG